MADYDLYEKIRDSKGLKNSDVAKLAKIPASTFTDWKKGKSFPKLEKLNKIAVALDCNLRDLTYEVDYVAYSGDDISLYLDKVPSDTDKNPSNIEKIILYLLSNLNSEGISEAVERIEELTQLDKYKK